MAYAIESWKTQLRKGYLELCILLIIRDRKRCYGFELLDAMNQFELPLKEGTLYPLLNRMTSDGTLSSVWETEQAKGHPRKFYSLTPNGLEALSEMLLEYQKQIKIFKTILNKETNHDTQTRT